MSRATTNEARTPGNNQARTEADAQRTKADVTNERKSSDLALFLEVDFVQ